MDLFTLSASLGLNISSFEHGINSARRLLLQFAGVVVDFSKDVIETGMGFDKQMSAVRAVMGLTQDTVENLDTMNYLRKFALEQARDSIFTSEEVATAYYYMGMAGWRAEQMVSGLPGVMALAAASGEDLKMTSDMVTDSLTAFGLGAGQASHFADVLAVTATNANTDVARMQQTFKNLAPIAGALGYSIEDVALSIGLIANSGIKGSLAGTALRNIFTRIATNAGATSKTLGALEVVTDELGVSFYTAEGRARPWGEVLTELRAAWNKLDPNEVDKVTAAFGGFFSSSQSADEIMADFASDLDVWTTSWNALTTDVDRERFANSIEDYFTAFGISMRDSNGKLREFSEVAKDARVKLGGLTDEEQILYAKQIGSLRGISGWLALMTASEEDVNQLTEAIENADGAAQAMADTRLDNLWGDVVHFKSVLDTLKIAIYDNVKGPLREIVQFGSDSLERITDAINENGLMGGIEQLGIEIELLGDKISPILESAGKALGPLLISLIDTVAPALVGSAVQLGVAFGSGLLDGITQGLAATNNPFLQNIRQWFGLSGQDIPQYSSLGLSTDATEMTVDVTPEVQADAIQAAIDNAVEEGRGTIEIDGNEVSILEADRIAADVAAGLGSISEVDGQPVADAVSGALANVDSSGLETAIESAGPPAGNALRKFIESALSGNPFNINVTANVSGLPNSGPTERHARSMFGGTILRGATVFGYNDRGHAMVGGGEGPEAVVGVNSLNAMIDDSVSNAVSRTMGEVLNRLDKIAGSFNRSMTVVLDTGVLAGEINNSLGKVQAWRGAGRA